MSKPVRVKWKGDFTASILLPDGAVIVKPGDEFMMPRDEAMAREDVTIVEHAQKSAPAKADKDSD